MAPLSHPKLRPLENHWIEKDGQPMLVLRDRLGLVDGVALLPPSLALFASLCDGSRSLAELRTAFALRSGLDLTPSQVEDIVSQFDSALLLDGPRLAEVKAAALADFRSAPHRPPALAGSTYPEKATACRRALLAYGGEDKKAVEPKAAEAIRGVISPHIDYQRGGPVYSRVWTLAAAAAARAEVVVIFGTDHVGGLGKLTMTRQSYATPFGVLPTDRAAVDTVAEAIGEDEAFDEELHHRTEHSIELAAVWLHHARGGKPCPIVPILCGSFHSLVTNTAEPADYARLDAALVALRRALDGRRVLVVAAADLAHVGPAFDDDEPFGEAERRELKGVDNRLLDAACSVDPEAFLGLVREEQDRWRVCGVPPIYLTLRLLGGGEGELVAYDQCPADEERGSWVSIAGVVLR